MSLTIEVPPEVEARLREKAAREGEPAESIAIQMLADALEWEAQEWKDAVECIRRGFEAVAAGRERTLDEYIAHKRAALGKPRSWPDSWPSMTRAKTRVTDDARR